jgi:hypothetical protein
MNSARVIPSHLKSQPLPPKKLQNPPMTQASKETPPDLSCVHVVKAEGRRFSYTDEEINRGLTAVALCSGNTRRAEHMLCEQGLAIDHKRLWAWQNLNFPTEYEIIKDQVVPQVYAGIAQSSEALAQRQADLEEKLTDEVEAALPHMKPGELSTALRNVTVSKAVNIDKASLIRGRPSVITEDHTIEATLRALSRYMPEVGNSALAKSVVAEDVEVVTLADTGPSRVAHSDA